MNIESMNKKGMDIESTGMRELSMEEVGEVSGGNPGMAIIAGAYFGAMAAAAAYAYF